MGKESILLLAFIVFSASITGLIVAWRKKVMSSFTDSPHLIFLFSSGE